MTTDDIQDLQHKADELNKQAWEIRVNDSLLAEKLSKEAIGIAESINYKKGKAEGYRTFGFTHIRKSNHNEGLEYLQKALGLFEELNDLEGQSSTYAYFGIIERSRGNLSASLGYLLKGLELARQVNWKENEALALYHIGVTYKYLGHYEQALEYLLQGLTIASEINFLIGESYCINLIGQVYFENGDHASALNYYERSLAIRRKSGDKWGEAGCLDNIGLTHFELQAYNEAKKFCEESLLITEAIGDKKGQGNALLHLGIINKALDNLSEAFSNGNRSLEIRREIYDKKGEAEILLFLAELDVKAHIEVRGSKKPLDLLNQAFALATQTEAIDLIAKVHAGYSEVYKRAGLYKEALDHIESYMKLSKEIHTEAVKKKIQNLEISHSIERSRQEAEIYRLRNIELAQLYEEIKLQKDEIEAQKKNAEEALIELKETQKQLIQREKMASLGELTAGIAHEIQNPLNFVNNFSEVSVELADEMENALQKDNKEKAITIAGEIKDNLQKITHHGKRADVIVKGMLQHSRSSTGKKELTDINKLADEYLRLSYHGLRAKEKAFNASFKTSFDESLGKIELAPQDIGRVLLNLYNNAFYSVTEKKKAATPDDSYQPTVWLTTKGINLPSGPAVEISVKDNGTGIPHKVLDKIYNPFFTTKPTGQGTGLGLSLSYDIITKGHGGELKVETKEGEFSTFTVIIPIPDSK
jgi:two-component system, NtrC family, sensor kinase